MKKRQKIKEEKEAWLTTYPERNFWRRGPQLLVKVTVVAEKLHFNHSDGHGWHSYLIKDSKNEIKEVLGDDLYFIR